MKKEWENKKLKQLCEVFVDGDWIESKDQSTKGIRLIQTGNVGNGLFKDRGEKSKYISESTFNRLRCTEIFEGDCLISRLPKPVGRSCIIPSTNEKMITAVDCTIVRFKSNLIISNYFNYYSQSNQYIGKIERETTGTTRSRISRSKLGDIEIPLPSISEQQRIVAILDEAFEAIAKAKENAEKNLQNSRELFESYVESVFADPGDGWTETNLGNEIDLLAGFAFKSTQYTSASNDIRLLSGDNIIQGSLRWEGVRRWPESDTFEYSRYQLRDGDVVLAMDRPWVKSGLKRAMISESDLPCLLVQRTARLRSGLRIDKRFLLHLIGSAKFTLHILGVQGGIGVPHISGQQIKDFKFLMPPLDEQRLITDNLNNMCEKTKKLEAIYQKKLTDLEELKKSILQKAFEGELTN